MDLLIYFIEEFRILRNDGKFLYTDTMRKQDIEYKERLLGDIGFRLIEKVNITDNVLLSMDIQEYSKARVFAYYGKLLEPESFNRQLEFI